MFKNIYPWKRDRSFVPKTKFRLDIQLLYFPLALTSNGMLVENTTSLYSKGIFLQGNCFLIGFW